MPQTQPLATRLFNEAAEWRLLSLLFSRPGEDWRDEITAAASELADPQLKDACAAALGEASEGLYHSLFGPGGPAPPREASYRTTLQLGYLLSELQTYYSSFGYAPASQETPDHVAVETDFEAYLHLKRALAIAAGHSDQAEVAAEASKGFIKGHLSFIAEPLHQSLAHSGVRYLEIASLVLRERVGPAESIPPLQDVAEELVTIQDAPFACGT